MIRRHVALTILVTSLFVASGIVHAQTSPTEIHACVNNSSGTIHIVAPNATCSANEMKLRWNVVGPRGPEGPAGPTTVFGLTVALAGDGSGAVVSSDDGINCGVDCTEVYPAGTSVTLTATPALGSTFAGWSGDCSATTSTCTVVLGTTRLVTARFDVPPPTTINGGYNLNQVVSYSCASGLLSYNISTFVFTASDPSLRVTGGPSFDPVMGGTGSAGGGDFSVQAVVPPVTYSLTGTFRDLTTWDGVFQFTCSGPDCSFLSPPCVNQTYTITGTRP